MPTDLPKNHTKKNHANGEEIEWTPAGVWWGVVLLYCGMQGIGWLIKWSLCGCI